MPSSHCPEHGRAEQDRFVGGDRRDGYVRRVGKDLADVAASRRAAARHHDADIDAACAQRIKDLPQAVADRNETGEIEADKTRFVAVEPEPGKHRPRLRIGERRPVAETPARHAALDQFGDGFGRGQFLRPLLSHCVSANRSSAHGVPAAHADATAR